MADDQHIDDTLAQIKRELHELKSQRSPVPQESINLWKVATVILGLFFVGFLAMSWFDIGGSEAGFVVRDAPTPTQGAPAPSPVVQVSADDDPAKGDENAPVTIIEFSDFQCPFCKRFFDDTLPALTQNYISTGKVKFVYRDLPLPFHSNAENAALAAECADDQDKFWEMHDLIFQRQDSWASGDAASLFKGYATELGLDDSAFGSCYDSRKHVSEIQKDLADASASGASGTPTFFINGQRLVGAQPYAAFQQLIEAELA